MTHYLLRGVPDAIWRKAKARAASEGHTLRWVLLHFLTSYAKESK